MGDGGGEWEGGEGIAGVRRWYRDSAMRRVERVGVDGGGGSGGTYDEVLAVDVPVFSDTVGALLLMLCCSGILLVLWTGTATCIICPRGRAAMFVEPGQDAED